MTIFTVTGEKSSDLWLVNNEPNFSFIPANTIPDICHDCPVWLKVGNHIYGETHIKQKHFHWVSLHKMTVPELVYHKLGQHGQMYCSEVNSKIKISLSLHPSALIIMNYMEKADTPHLSVTTIYSHQGHLDGSKIARYKGR